MLVNLRKPLSFRNRTNYFDPGSTRTVVTVQSPNTYQFLTSKQEGYYNRIYWEYRYCLDHNGQTFYYTLTYNDKSMPRYEGHNCFDYNDLVYLLNGAFKKYLLRHYGTNFKYFVGAELGEGAGSRGMHNNPHYHILFFLRDACSDDYPYIKISPSDFRHLIRVYWQGFDEDIDGFKPYQSAKFGIAKEGENLGLVIDFRACSYVTKYVTKDVGLKRFEKSLEVSLKSRFESDFKIRCEIDEHFWREYIVPRYNIPSKFHLGSNHSDWLYSDIYLLKKLSEEVYDLWDSERKRRFEVQFPVYPFVRSLVDAINLRVEFRSFSDNYISELVSLKLSEFRNRYSNKCRISQGVGDYALKFIKDSENPCITVPSASGFKTRPLGIYYYRKLFTQVVKDPFGNPIRVLNDAGIEYKLRKFPLDLERLEISTAANLEIVSSQIYSEMLNSDINVDVSLPYEHFLNFLNDKPLIIKRYAEYKLVYEGRYFALDSKDSSSSSGCPVLNPTSDLRRFLKPSYFYQPYNFRALDDFFEEGTPGYFPYSFHPYFRDYIIVFGVIDLLSAYLFVQTDKFNEAKALNREITKKFHKGLDLQSFYNQFK